MPQMPDFDLAYSKKREQAERQASALAKDMCSKAAHKSLAALYGDRVVSARRSITRVASSFSANRRAAFTLTRGQ